MVPTDLPAEPNRQALGRWPAMLAGLLLLNFGVVTSLAISQVRLGRRPHRLETADGAAHAGHSARAGQFNEEVPGAAGRQERIALLLAAATDPDGTRHLLGAMPPAERTEIARALIGRAPNNDRNAALGALLQKIAEVDPAAAVGLLATVPEAGLRQLFAAQVAAAWIEHDPAGGAAWLAGAGQHFLAGSVLDQLRTTALTRWSTFDPAAAARFAAARAPADAGEVQALRNASRDWARQDPAAALAWAQSLPEGDPRKSPATYGVLEGWTEVNPAQAAAFVGQLSDGSRVAAASAVATHWAERDPAAAALWAASLPSRAARRDALHQVASTWAAADVPTAARWAAELPPDAERGDIWREIAARWTDADATGAENWLSTLPAGGDRDVAVAAFALQVVAADPEKALSWAKTLSSGPFAARQIADLLAVWSRKDRLAARNWAAANQVAPETADVVR